MEPITIAGIIVGLVGIFVARKNIVNFVKSVRPKESVAIFGPKKSGKTTLIRYLKGEPLPEQYIYTYGAQQVGKIVFDLSGNETYYFRSREMYDVGGEHTNQWQAIIEEQNPDGIIYIIDTQSPAKEKQGLKYIAEVYHEIRVHNLSEKLRLRTVLILLNKCDLWGTSPGERDQILNEYRNNILSKSIAKLRSEFGNIEIQVGCSSLTKSEYSQITNDSLRHFAAKIALNKE